MGDTQDLEELFQKPWEEDPSKTTVQIESDPYDVESDETIQFEYDRSLLFPITRWVQNHRGETITHDLYDEFRSLCVEVKGDFIDHHNYSDDASTAAHALIMPVTNCMLALWDMRAELRPWIVQTICKMLVGLHSTDHGLPTPQTEAFKREQEYRGGPNDMEKALGKLGDAILKGETE